MGDHVSFCCIQSKGVQTPQPLGKCQENQKAVDPQIPVLKHLPQSLTSEQSPKRKQITWDQILFKMKETLLKTNPKKNLVQHEFWNYLISKFDNYFFNKDQKLQFLELLSKFFEMNFGNKTVEDAFQFCGQLGQKFHLFQNRLHFKQKHFFEYANFLIPEKENQTISGKIHFSNLRFDLSTQQTLKIAQVVRQFCTYEMNTFCFLSLYLQLSIQNQLRSQSLQKVQVEFQKQMKNLKTKYPANDAETESINVNFRFSESVKFETQIFIFKDDNKSNLDELRQFILWKAEKAKSEQKLFVDLNENICFETGYSFKSGLKIKNKYNTAAIDRTIEKIMEKLFKNKKYKDQIQDLKKSTTRSQIKIKSYKKQEINNFIQNQINQVQKELAKILEDQKTIQFDVKDLLRAKCTFLKIQDIVYTVNKLIEHIKKKGYAVIQLKNRLGNNTKDVTLIIKLPNSIAELQLALKLDSTSNQFNHKIYEIMRSTMYTPITNLFLQNRRWSSNFFTDLFQLVLQTFKIKSNSISQKQSNFKDILSDLIEFGQKFLKFNDLIYQKSLSSKYEEMKQVQEKLKETSIIVQDSQKNKNEFQRLGRMNFQISNEINFYKRNFQYEKGLNLLSKIDSKQLEKDTFLLKLKGDILHKKGHVSQSLKCYLRCIELYQEANDEGYNYATVLNQIGMAYDQKGQFQTALEYYEKSQKLKGKIKGQNSIDVANEYNNKAITYKNKKDYVNSLFYYQKGLSITIDRKGNDSIQVAQILQNIGVVYDVQQDYTNAIDYYKRALQIKKKLKGNDSLDVALTLNNIGSMYGSKGDLQNALISFKKSLQIRTQIKGSDSIDLPKTLLNLSLLHDRMKNYEQSYDYAQRAFNIWKSFYGQQHQFTVMAMKQIDRIKSFLENRKK